MEAEQLQARLKTVLADRYEIQRELGRGGMATVYLARELKHARSVAIKVVLPEVSAALGPERFLREIQIASHLSHPHILPLYDSGEAAGTLYYVMPYVEGESLRQRLNREKHLGLDDACRITRQVADALDYAHRNGVVHRDIKPENILLAGSMAVVADFGVARALTAAGADTLTATGFAVGTPAYMSPEQAHGDGPPTARCDIYSLGCVIYEMLAGAPPFTGPSVQAILARHSVDPVPSLRTVRPSITPSLEAVILKALAKTPVDRYATVGQLADELEAAARGEGGRRAGAGAWRLARRVAIGLAAAGAVLVLALAIRGLVSRPGGRAPTVAVLPFEHFGPPPDRYLADGLTDEITSRVAQISGLDVISPRSSSAFTGPETNLRQAGRDLGAAYLLVGAITTDRRPDGSGTVRVVPRLIRTSDERELWSERLDASLTPGELFAVQSSVARNVAQQLGVTLLAPERRALDARPTENPRAYDYYLRGSSAGERIYLEPRLRAAIAMYDSAVVLDPAFALAWARLSQAQSLYYYHFDRSQDRLQAARAAADSAFRLDQLLPESRVAKGYLYYWAYLDYDLALEQLAVARQAQPNNSELLWIIGAVERRQGNWQEALTSTKRALELDPRSQLYALEAAGTSHGLGQYAEAEQYYNLGIRLAPDGLSPYIAKAILYTTWRGDTLRTRGVMDSALVRIDSAQVFTMLPQALYRWLLALLGEDYFRVLHRLARPSAQLDSGSYFLGRAETYRWQGRLEQARPYYDSARVWWEARVAAHPDDPLGFSELGVANAGLGRREAALRAGETAVRLVPISKDGHRGPTWALYLAQIDVMVGEQDAAIEQISAIFQHPSLISRAFVRVHPNFAPLRNHPKFAGLVGQP